VWLGAKLPISYAVTVVIDPIANFYAAVGDLAFTAVGLELIGIPKSRRALNQVASTIDTSTHGIGVCTPMAARTAIRIVAAKVNAPTAAGRWASA
jgi:hypothetical protein